MHEIPALVDVEWTILLDRHSLLSRCIVDDFVVFNVSCSSIVTLSYVHSYEILRLI